MGRSFGGRGKDGSRRTAGQSVTVGMVWSVVSSEGLDASKEGRQKGDQVGRANEAPRCQGRSWPHPCFWLGFSSPCLHTPSLQLLEHPLSVSLSVPFPSPSPSFWSPPLSPPRHADALEHCSAPRLLSFFHLAFICLSFLSLDTTSPQGLGLCPHP